MITLRIFISNDDLVNNQCAWQLVSGTELLESGESILVSLFELNFDQIEVYLAPELATILKVELGAISDRKINDELLLGVIEDSLAEDIENCKPILMRLSDGESYIAILNRDFHTRLLSYFQEHVKQVKFIQPFPYLVHYEPQIWTLYMQGQQKFLRTSQYEYFLLDDEPISLLLSTMLKNYSADKLFIYTEDNLISDYITKEFKLDCHTLTDLDYGNSNWNFYNEKSKRFNLKLTPEAQGSLWRVAKVAGIFLAVYLIFWLANLGFLIIEKNKLQRQVTHDLAGIVKTDKYTPNLLAQVDEQLTGLFHNNGTYAPSDFISLFDVFMRNVPDVNSSVLAGMQYSGNQLNIFLNSQFNSERFNNDRSLLKLNRVAATLTDYKSYQANQTATNTNNNGGGVLDNLNSPSSTTAQMSDVAWVISLQMISRMDELNEK